MNNLFSIFEPQACFGLSLNWISASVALLFFPPAYWMASSQTATAWKMVLLSVNSEFRMIWGKQANPGVGIMSCSLLAFLMLNNSLGLVPYIFTASSHLTFTISMALPLWAGHIIWSTWRNLNHAFAHLVPLGSPMALSPFMVVIELVSNVIRPLTLSVRLAANMVAGHLLLCLISNPSNISVSSALAIFVSLIILLTLEASVALIQAYVFSVLSTLYLGEVNSPTLD